jgi:hypothetical protein
LRSKTRGAGGVVPGAERMPGATCPRRWITSLRCMAGILGVDPAQREEATAAPDAELLCAVAGPEFPHFDQVIIDRAEDPCLKALAHRNIRAGRAARRIVIDANRMVLVRCHNVIDVGAEGEAALRSSADRVDLDGDEGRVIDQDAAALDRRHQPELAIFMPQYRGE